MIVCFHRQGVVGVLSAPHDVGISRAAVCHGGCPQLRARGVGHGHIIAGSAVDRHPSEGVGGFAQGHLYARNGHRALLRYDIRVFVNAVHANGVRPRLIREVHHRGVGEGGSVVSRARKVRHRIAAGIHQLISFRRAERVLRLPGEGDRVYRLIVGGGLHRHIFVGFSQSVEHSLFGSADLTADSVQFGIYLYEVGVCGGHVRGVYARGFVKGEARCVCRARIEQQGTLFFIYTIYLIIYAACRAVLVPYQFDFVLVLDRVSPEIQIAGEVHQAAEQTAQGEIFRQGVEQICEHGVKPGIGHHILAQAEVAEVDIQIVLLVEQYLRNRFACVVDAQFDYLLSSLLVKFDCKGDDRFVRANAQVDGFEQRLDVLVHVGDKPYHLAYQVGYAGILIGESDGKGESAVKELVEQAVEQGVVGVLPIRLRKRCGDGGVDMRLYAAAYLPFIGKVEGKGGVEPGWAALFGCEQVARHLSGERAVFQLDVDERFPLQELTCVEVDVQAEGREQAEHAREGRRGSQQIVVDR